MERAGVTRSVLARGDESLGSYLTAAGIPTIPSSAHPRCPPEGSSTFFSGHFTAMHYAGTVRVFRQKSTLEDAIELHAFAPLEVSRRVTNGILLGCPLSYRFTLQIGSKH
jgi:hypothetical protein